MGEQRSCPTDCAHTYQASGGQLSPHTVHSSCKTTAGGSSHHRSEARPACHPRTALPGFEALLAYEAPNA